MLCLCFSNSKWCMHGNCGQCCDHPYIMDPSLQISLTKDSKEADILDIGIKASGKLQLLDAMLFNIKERGLRVLVLFQVHDSWSDIIFVCKISFFAQVFSLKSQLYTLKIIVSCYYDCFEYLCPLVWDSVIFCIGVPDKVLTLTFLQETGFQFLIMFHNFFEREYANNHADCFMEITWTGLSKQNIIGIHGSGLFYFYIMHITHQVRNLDIYILLFILFRVLFIRYIVLKRWNYKCHTYILV